MNGQLTALSSMATRHILSDLARDYESQTGVHVEIQHLLPHRCQETEMTLLARIFLGDLQFDGLIRFLEPAE